MTEGGTSGQTPFRLRRTAWALVPFFLLGCGSDEAYVSGKATLDNEPLVRAQVVFVGEDEKNRAPIVAQTNDEGHYKLIGNKARGIPVGKYKVVVTKTGLGKDGAPPQGEDLDNPKVKSKLRSFVHKIYGDRATTPLQFDVRAGTQTIDLELKKKP